MLYVRTVRNDNEWKVNVYRPGGSLERTIFTYRSNPDDRYADYMILYGSPAGDRICINYQAEGKSRIVMLRPDGEEVFSQVTALGFYGGYTGQADWSPDGQWLVFAGKGENTYIDIYLVDKNGEHLTQLTNNYAKNSAPVFLPQGKKIQYFEGEYNKVMTLEDKSVVSLGSDYPRSWTRDEKFYITGGNTRTVKLVNAETRESKIIYTVQAQGEHIYTQDMAFSPDEQWALISEYDGEQTHIPFGEAWYKVDINNPGSAELIAYGGNIKFTPDETMMIIYGFLPNESTYGTPRYYAIKLESMEVIPLDDRAAGMRAGFWLQGAEPSKPIDSKIFLGPTLVPTWPALGELPIYDSFDGQALNESAWDISGTPSKDQYEWTIFQQALNIQTKAKIAAGGLDFRQNESIPSNSFSAFESKMKLWSGTNGFGFAKIQLTSGSWWTQCRLTNEETTTFFVCEVVSGQGGDNIAEYMTREVPAARNTWYDVRIELSHASGAVQFYLNGELINTYRPEYAEKLISGVPLTPSLGVYLTNGGINASFDDVRLGK